MGMHLKSIKEMNFSNERVLVRVDFNMELEEMTQNSEHFRLGIVKQTIDYIASFPGVKIALLTHLGRPERATAQFSVKHIIPLVEHALARPVVFVTDCVGALVENALLALPQGSVLLLENVRYYPEEESNSLEFASALAKPFSLFVNEAFSVCHRAHASIVMVPSLLPAGAGFRLLEECEKLDQVHFSPEHPAVAVIGGAKIETKLPLIHAFEKKYDAILVGGKIANEAIDKQMIFSEKVFLPQDFSSVNRLDIGLNTIAQYTQIIRLAKTVVWNGPLGKFEETPYDIGTFAILHALLENKNAFVVIGGGESLAVLEKANVMNKIGFVSAGGGAMLEYLSGNILPGLEALKV
ncbi:MAG: phosphoglycerate kinase [Minisyncoccota bacterium]